MKTLAIVEEDFHLGWTKNRGAAHRAGAEVRYLSAYSPDLNPIEQLFSKLKAALRSAAAARTVDGLIEAMGEGLRAIRAGDIRGWFRHNGYPTGSSTVTVNEKSL